MTRSNRCPLYFTRRKSLKAAWYPGSGNLAWSMYSENSSRDRLPDPGRVFAAAHGRPRRTSAHLAWSSTGRAPASDAGRSQRPRSARRTPTVTAINRQRRERRRAERAVHTRQKSISAVILRNRGVRIVSGCSHVPARDERVVVGQHRARVQRVVDIERDQRSRAPDAQGLGHPNVELVDAIAVHRPGRHEVDRHVGRVSRQIPPKRRRHGRVRRRVVGGQHRARLALKRRAPAGRRPSGRCTTRDP